MKYHLSRAGRRAVVVAGTAVAGLAITSAAFAASSCVWVADGQANGAAGTIYYPLEFTNLSGHSCSMHGFPGVSAISRSGRQLGSPARWRSGGGTPRTVIVRPGATVHATLAYSDAVVGSVTGCDPVSTTSELRIYLPDQRSATFAFFFDLKACSHAGPIYLAVGPIKPGVGTING